MPLIDLDGNVYSPYYFEGSFSGMSTSPYTADKKCTILGTTIPIYDLWERFYISDFSNGNNYGGYRYYTLYGYNYYICGFVIALTEPYTDDTGVTKINALVAHKLDTAARTQSERIAEINNGAYTNNSPILISFMTANYVEGTNDYRKFIYAGGNGNAWISGRGATTTSFYQLMGVVGWQDGVGTVTGNTLCIPFVCHCTDQIGTQYEWICGIIGRFNTQNSLFPAGSVEDLVVSEDPDDYVMLQYNLCAIAPYKNNVDFENAYWSGYTPPPPPPEYPFEDDYNGGGGGTGDYRDTSDTVPIDGTPTNSAIASGFVNAYLLTQQQVNDFHSYLYSTDFLDNVKRLMNDPIDYILAFMLAPYTPETSSTVYITVGGTTSEVQGARISSGYKTVDCGTITLSEFWGKFYDYNPYTKIQIYLPFIGMRSLDVDDVMAGQVNLSYRIDVLTGACVATISVNNARGTNGAIYNFNGNCHSHIPVSGKNYLETVTNVLSAGVGALSGIAGSATPELATAAGAINVMRSAKVSVEHAGELTGATGLLANFTPFLMVSRPSQSLAQNYNHYKGFISNVTKTLGDLSGYTEVAELVQTNIHCTLDEFDEINELLKEGVYL